MPIYTKKGDKGETGLFSSDPTKKIRISKSSQIIKTIGAVDELNSFTGIIISESDNAELKSELTNIQSDLLTIGSMIAGSKLSISKKRALEFEKKIDEMDRKLPTLKNFILPGGTRVASRLQFMRSLVRRTERELVMLADEKNINPEILTYINRLSDYIYTLARFENWKNKFEDKIWKQ